MTRPGTSRAFAAIATAAIAIVGGLVFSARVGGDQQGGLSHDRVGRGGTAPVVSRDEQAVRVETGSRELLAQFSHRGRRLRLERAVMSDGSECLLHAEVERGVSGSQCFRNGLFRSSRVAFTIHSEGGPERFSSMYLMGMAHPAVARIELSKTDGSSAGVDVGERGAFLAESSAAELASDVFPAALRVYGRGGRVVETVDIPGPR